MSLPWPPMTWNNNNRNSSDHCYVYLKTSLINRSDRDKKKKIVKIHACCYSYSRYFKLPQQIRVSIWTPTFQIPYCGRVTCKAWIQSQCVSNDHWSPIICYHCVWKYKRNYGATCYTLKNIHMLAWDLKWYMNMLLDELMMMSYGDSGH